MIQKHPKELENEGKWREAANAWIAGYGGGDYEYCKNQQAVCNLLANAIDKGNHYRSEVERIKQEHPSLVCPYCGETNPTLLQEVYEKVYKKSETN